MAFARFTQGQIQDLVAAGWVRGLDFPDGAPRTFFHPDAVVTISASFDLETRRPMFHASFSDIGVPWWPADRGGIYEDDLPLLLSTLRGLVDAWAAGVQARAERAQRAFPGRRLCERGCGRPVDSGPHRPDPRSPLAGFCHRCPQVARRRVRDRGGDPDVESTLVAELRRPPTRGPAPGAGRKG